MKKIISFIFLAFFMSNYANATENLLSVESQFSVKETADRFVSILEKKGVTLFARIDHKKNAKGVNLALRETEVIMFGNPRIGTPLMKCSQTVGIDLPQKMLIWKDVNNKVWLAYNNPEYIKQRHDVKGCDPVFDKVAGVLSALAKAAASK